MKRYSSLIRKLVDATAEAEAKGTDVADILKSRCFNDTSLIRQTLMNAVCDPRFKIDADVVGYWKDEARYALEQLVEQLEKTIPLTEETAFYMLDSFLNAWLRMTFSEVIRSEKRKATFYEMPPKQEEERNVKDALDCLENMDELLGLPTKGMAKGETKKEKEKRFDKPFSSDENSQEEKKEETRQDNRRRKNVGPTSSTSMQKLEERFLQKIPQSLVELARRIGRMGENGMHKEGKFISAGKSDIAGITIGNDISAVLPSELAMLAEKRTQTVFYRNFTARRLQLFASASQSKSPNKHQDGPVIVCIDTSSSMTGEPMMVAKALAVAVAIIAWRRKRDVIMVKYSNDYECIDLGHNRSMFAEMIQFLSYVASGGNNENGLFKWLFNEIIPNHEEYDTADLLSISDFGWTYLLPETEQIILDQKKQGMRFYGLNVDSGSLFADCQLYDGSMSPMDVCDSMWIYENGECKEVKETQKTETNIEK